MYPCRICKAEFPLKSGRDRHEARRHGAFRLKCTICSARYRHRDDLRAHVKRRHGGQGEAPATSVRRRLYSEDVDLAQSPRYSSLADFLRPSEPSEADVAEVGMCPEPVEDVVEGGREDVAEVEDVVEGVREEMADSGCPDLRDAPTGAEEFQRYLVEEEESFTEYFESGAIKSCRKTIKRYKLI